MIGFIFDMEDKFVLVSLNDKKSKKIAEVISNETARKILDYLGEKNKVSPIELSKKLNVPISTITYNLKLLSEQGLIIKEDEVWSDKGRKVSLYSIAQKMILIIPKGFDWKDSLKKILPVFLLGTLATLGTWVYETFFNVSRAIVTEDYAIPVVEDVLKSNQVLLESTNEAMTVSQSTHYWVYVLGATLLITLILFIIESWRMKK